MIWAETTSEATDSDLRLHILLLEQQGVAALEAQTVSETVSKPARAITIRPIRPKFATTGPQLTHALSSVWLTIHNLKVIVYESAVYFVPTLGRVLLRRSKHRQAKQPSHQRQEHQKIITAEVNGYEAARINEWTTVA